MTDALLVLRLLANETHQMLSRGELKRRGCTDDDIDAASQLGHVGIAGIGNTRDGEKSSIASVFLTIDGENFLDSAEADA